jgi:hypothetical protein
MMSWDLIAHPARHLPSALKDSRLSGSVTDDGAESIDPTSPPAADYLFSGGVSNGLSCGDLIRSSESLLTSIATAENHPTH